MTAIYRIKKSKTDFLIFKNRNSKIVFCFKEKIFFIKNNTKPFAFRMSQPSRFPIKIYEYNINSTHLKYAVVFFIKKNLYMVECRNDNFELYGQTEPKEYLTTKELKKEYTENHYTLIYEDNEDDGIKYDKFIHKNIWHDYEDFYSDEEESEDEAESTSVPNYSNLTADQMLEMAKNRLKSLEEDKDEDPSSEDNE
jgi:hypothetical protein